MLEQAFAKSSGLFDSLDKTSVYRLIVIVGSLGFIFLGCLITLRPFFPALLLATILCMATWPAFIWLKVKLNGRHTLAAVLMTILLALCFLLPLVFLASNLGDNFSKLFNMGMATLRNDSGPPSWVEDIPGLGGMLDEIFAAYPENQAQLVAPVTEKLIAIGAGIGRGAIDIAVGVLIAFFFFCHGSEAAYHLRNLIQKFAGPRGQHLLSVSKNTMIGVVYGILGTALAQGGLAVLGFWIAGVPAAPLLGFATFLLSFIQIGPPMIWVPATIWLFAQGEIGMGMFMGLWGLCAISAIDNIIRPYFISLGTNLPFLLVLLGVIGGILAFGFIGLFIGPTLLAVGYTIIMEWSTGRDADGTPTSSGLIINPSDAGATA
ncbi:MAG: AI-2E family transporter [Micavibrio sp.]